MVHASADEFALEIDIDSDLDHQLSKRETCSSQSIMEAALAARNSRVAAGATPTFMFSDLHYERYERSSMCSSRSGRKGKSDDNRSSYSGKGSLCLSNSQVESFGSGGNHEPGTPNCPFESANDNLDEEEAHSDDSMYRNSNLMKQQRIEASTTRSSSSNAQDVFVRGSLFGRGIEATQPSDFVQESPRRYKGRIRTWPGVCFVTCMVAASVFCVTYFGIRHHQTAQTRVDQAEMNIFKNKQISGGKSTTKTTNRTEDIISDDGIVGNPKVYPDSTCELPNYMSKNGRIFAVSSNGTEVPIALKGVNWFGMETDEGLPFGLWDNSDNGTDAYQVAMFLERNNFNAVRLPLMASSILSNKKPNINMINRQANRAINVTNYISTLQSVIKVLQFRKIGVLLSMHTLTNDDNGRLWYNSAVSEKDFLKAIGILTSSLCSYEYWNVMGIDLKNEPFKATWGDGTATDFRDGAERIANTMLAGCDKWLGFVEGVNGQRTVTIDGEEFEYYDWYGGGLQGVKASPLEFKIPNKLVWAPHYYTPAVYPQLYFYGGGKRGPGDTLQGYVELDDNTLRHRVEATMNDMFGYLASETGPTLVLGEFGGLYTSDRHPMFTARRCTDFSIQVAKQPGWSGGFMWSLNPESKYQYNPADSGGPDGNFREGLMQDDWMSANDVYLTSLSAMDTLPNLRPFPCFPQGSDSHSRSSRSSA